MKRRVELSEAALLDLVESATWYEQHQRGWGDVFTVAVEATLEKIRRSPERYVVADEPVRRAMVERFPYGIFYTIEKDCIDVIAIVHTSRDPNVWHRRSKSP